MFEKCSGVLSSRVQPALECSSAEKQEVVATEAMRTGRLRYLRASN